MGYVTTRERGGFLASIGPAGIEMQSRRRGAAPRARLQSDQQELKLEPANWQFQDDDASIGPAGIEIRLIAENRVLRHMLQSDQQELKYAELKLRRKTAAGFNRTSRN